MAKKDKMIAKLEKRVREAETSLDKAKVLLNKLRPADEPAQAVAADAVVKPAGPKGAKPGTAPAEEKTDSARA